MLKPIYQFFRNIVFRVGHTRWLGWKSFPFMVNWIPHEPKISLHEVLNDALPRLLPGDVILHRDDGYLSNRFIGKGMTHAGLYIGGGMVVEALAQGVVKRSAAHILFSDRAVILRPNLPADKYQVATFTACMWAENIVGFPYDVLFRFNTTAEKNLILKEGKEEAIKKGVAFCCTEIPGFCYLQYLKDLNIKYVRNDGILTRCLRFLGLKVGHDVITADHYLTANFNIIWCSGRLTEIWCKRQGLNDEYVAKIWDYWLRSSSSSKGLAYPSVVMNK